MKKQLILIMSLILLVGITVGVLMFVNHMENEQAAEKQREEEAKVLFTTPSNDVDRIELSTPDGEYNAYLNESGQWTLENDVDFEINTYYLNSMASQLSTLNALEVICPIEGASLSDYGLDNPTVISMHSEDTVNTLNVGKLSATEEFYYVTVEGRDEIFSLSVDLKDYLNINKNSLKSIYIMRNSDSPVEYVSLEAHGEKVYELNMNDEGIWSMSVPVEITDRINTSGVNNLLTTIRQMIVDKFGEENVTEDRYAELGFESPEYVFTYTQENGEATTILAQDYNVDDVSFVCLLCKETGQVFYMESSYTSFLQGTPDNFILDSIYSCSVNDIASVDIKWNEREDAAILIDEENGDYSLNGTSLESGGAEAVAALENFYTKLNAMDYDNFVLECPVDKNTEADISVTYTEKDGTKTVVEYHKSSEDALAVFVNGEYSYFTVNRKNFTARDGIYDYYDRFLDAADAE